MKIGIKTNPQHTTWSAMLEAWQRADQRSELESAWVFDHFYPIFSDSDGPCLESWTSLSALAGATERIRVGSMVNGMPYRHPAITANMAATVDVISNGRLNLGLGAGWNEQESSAYGISLGENLTERFDRFDEGVEIVIGLLRDEFTTFEGDHFQITNARNEPKGPQLPHPPITIGGGGEKRTLRTVARFAQHWNVPPVDDLAWQHKRDVLAAHCADLDRDVSEIECSMMVRFDPDDESGLSREIEEKADWGLDAVIVNLPSPHDPDHVDVVADLAATFI